MLLEPLKKNQQEFSRSEIAILAFQLKTLALFMDEHSTSLLQD